MAHSSAQSSQHQIEKHIASHRPSRRGDEHSVADSRRTQGEGEQQHEEEYYVVVARKAFELFERRGGDHGHDVEDWLEAERMVMEEIGSET